MKKNRNFNEKKDPREILYKNLLKKGVNDHNAKIISLDAGLGLVDKKYLISLSLPNKYLKSSIQLLKNFYFGEYD